MDKVTRDAINEKRESLIFLLEYHGAHSLADLLTAFRFKEADLVRTALQELCEMGEVREELYEETIIYDLPCQRWPTAA